MRPPRHWIGRRRHAHLVTSCHAVNGRNIGNVKVTGWALTNGHYLGRLAGPKLLLAGTSTIWHIVDVNSADHIKRIMRPFSDGGQAGGSDIVLDIASAGGLFHLISHHQAIICNSDGRFMWRDAVDSFRKHLVAQFVTRDNLILINGLLPNVQAQGDVADQPGIVLFGNAQSQLLQYRLHILDRASGMIIDEYDLPPLAESIDGKASAVIDNRLLLVTRSETLVITGSDDSLR